MTKYVSSVRKGTFRCLQHPRDCRLQGLDGLQGFLLKLEVLGEFCKANHKICEGALRDHDSKSCGIDLDHLLKSNIDKSFYNGVSYALYLPCRICLPYGSRAATVKTPNMVFQPDRMLSPRA